MKLDIDVEYTIFNCWIFFAKQKVCYKMQWLSEMWSKDSLISFHFSLLLLLMLFTLLCIFINMYYVHCCHQKIKHWFQTFFLCIACIVRKPFYIINAYQRFLLLWFYNAWNLFIASILFETYTLNIYWRYHSILRIKYEWILRWKQAYSM